MRVGRTQAPHKPYRTGHEEQGHLHKQWPVALRASVMDPREVAREEEAPASGRAEREQTGSDETAQHPEPSCYALFATLTHL